MCRSNLVYFNTIKTNRVRGAAGVGANKGDLWKAVRLAKGVNVEQIPLNLTYGGIPVAQTDSANAFASFFSKKIENLVKDTAPNLNVYNGKNKLIVQNRNFMCREDIIECLRSIKSKRCEGYDRIPVCILTDSSNLLIDPLTELFQKIYSTGLLPDQWKISKTIPIFKKGNKSAIENYRPIANLCSASKLFEKLILKQIHANPSTFTS